MFHKRGLMMASAFVLVAVLFVPVLSFAPGISPAHAGLHQTFTGTITSGADYDLYAVNLGMGWNIVATLVCAEIAPGNRPLDPVLSVYYPGSDPSNPGDYDQYDDDGFGTYYDPNGVNCNAFASSRVIFTTPVSGTYTFRADGYSDATGPYILTISDNTAGGCDTRMVIPSTAVGGTFVSDALLYSEPGNPISPALTMTAGKSALVLGVDTSGQYYEILWVCSYLWVPRDSMGPNYDAVWGGRPLPTNVITATGK